MINLIKNNKLLQIYNRFILKRPLLGTALTSATGMGVGNLICQAMMYNKNKKIDLKQTLRYSMFGLLISGPFLKYWWYALDLKIFRNPNQFLRPVKMMLADQATSPFILNGAFLYFLAITEGKTNQEALNNLKQKLLPICIESYKIWPLVILLNFYIIPLHNRVLFSNVIAILWTVYLTYLISYTQPNSKPK